MREEAIRRSATSADGSEIPFLLLRSNDWVKPVREAAQSALRARLAPAHVPDLVKALPMLDAMHRWGRLGSSNIVDDIEQLPFFAYLIQTHVAFECCLASHFSNAALVANATT